MRKIFLTIMCALSLNAMAQGIIVHETNSNQTTYKSTDVERIEFSSTVTESTSSSYATKQQLEQGLDTKADKSTITALEDRITALEITVSELEKKIEALLKPSAEFEDIIVNGHTYHLGVSGAVDLGLSVKWATTNVGASSPADYGDYYAWGETATKSDYSWDTYFDSVNGSSSDFDKYGINKKTVLDQVDDVAHVKWGGSWRMPTNAEQDDLRNKCTWVWTTYDGHNGYVVAGSNGNSIFLPAAGYRIDGSLDNDGSYGCYWSSTLFGAFSSYESCLVTFTSGSVDWNRARRCSGRSIRPVCP